MQQILEADDVVNFVKSYVQSYLILQLSDKCSELKFLKSSVFIAELDTSDKNDEMNYFWTASFNGPGMYNQTENISSFWAFIFLL